MSAAQYLERERAAADKHELWQGEVFAMAGASLVHNQIVGNLARALGNLLAEGPCLVLASDMKVYIPLRDAFVYPDLSVVCEAPQLLGEHEVITNPSLIVEVLSDSTEGYDRGEKAAHFRRLASLQEYVLLAQHERRVEVFRRSAAGHWELHEFVAGQQVELASIGCMIAVDDIYRDLLDLPETTLG